MWDFILKLFGTVVMGSLLWLAIIFLAALLTEVAFPGACPFLEALLILAGFKMAQGTQPGMLVPFLATTYTGRLCGSSALYLFSAFPGGKLLDKLGRRVRTTLIWARWLRWKLREFSLPIIIVARFTPGFGIASTVTCGISRIEYKKFFVALTIHVIAWEAIFLGLGALGAGVSQFCHFVSRPLFLIVWIAVTITLGVGLGFLFFRRAKARLQLVPNKGQSARVGM